ncbi:hypothetical protein M378DRAFT_186814 [Amanita muscaria Koide BX008]|uniref:Chromosome transmission fidelity protein 8 n=1 Tax=Amanita muscaria (strain Koide BX008) TaxID=946122 RepID=A0A0C2X6A9_AMAMK|nr:hypothetical protein M378DRAFT_186814 [Amanita muscaria Koide BX008]
MIIPITVAAPCSPNLLPPSLAKISHGEVVLIELQGSLNIECDEATDRNGQLVGILRVDETGNKPTLTIGHHFLEGKVVSLAKPIAILLRDNAEIEDCEHSQEAKPWRITALVKRKIVFSKRPMPITKQP